MARDRRPVASAQQSIVEVERGRPYDPLEKGREKRAINLAAGAIFLKIVAVTLLVA